MALTAAEQAELNSLNQRAGVQAQTITQQPVQVPQQPSGLTQQESIELQALNERANIQQADQQRIDELFGQLRGTLPSQKLPPQREEIGALSGFVPTPTAGLVAGRVRSRIEQQREQAFGELQQRGFTPEQIDLTLQTQKILDRPKIGRPAGGIAGALTATAIAGRIIPGPFDDAAILAALIATGGAGAGGVTGEAIQTGIEEKRLIGTREALTAFATEAGTELAGRGLVRVGKFALSPFIRKTVPEAAALIDDYAKVGGSFSPTELDKRFTLNIAESFSRGSFGAKQIFQEFEEKQGRAVLAFADNIIESIGEGVARQTPEEIGQIFAEGITKPGGRILNLLDDLFKPLYDQLDELTKATIISETTQISVPSTILDETGKPIEKFITRVIGERIQGTGVSTASLKGFRAKIIAQNQRLVDIAKRTGKELPLVSPAGKAILNDIDNLPKFVGHSDYRAFRTKALKESRKLNRDIDVSESMIKQISSITRKELLDPKTVAGASPQAKRLHANVSNLFSTAQEGLKTTFPETLAKRLLRNPSSVIKEVFPSGNPKAIRLLRKSLVEPISGRPSAEGKILFNQLRQAWLADVVEQATKEGVAKPKVFNNLIRKLGKKSLREMFPDAKSFAGVKKIQSLFEGAGKGPPAGTSLFSRTAQVGGLALMYKSGKEGDFIGFTAGSVLAIGPLAFAKVATNPKGAKFLTSGFKMKPGASGLVPAAVRMIRLLKEINLKERKTILTQKKQQRQAGAALRTPTLEQLRGFGGRGF